jgi:hypothetical protein
VANEIVNAEKQNSLRCRIWLLKLQLCLEILKSVGFISYEFFRRYNMTTDNIIDLKNTYDIAAEYTRKRRQPVL